jgi:hypothetical protein
VVAGPCERIAAQPLFVATSQDSRRGNEIGQQAVTNFWRTIGDPKNPAQVMDDPDDIDNPILSFFLNYWRSRKGSNPLPLNSQFVPQEVRGYLPWVVVGEALPGYEDFRYRVVGTNVTQYFLSDATGKTIREAFADQGEQWQTDTIKLNQYACRTRVPFRMMAPETVSGDKYFPEYDVLYLPYSSNGSDVDRVIKAFTFDIGRLAAMRATASRA